ncbi:peptide ligase PGM1-related protein [Actinacidiphila alni]|uniref:preATP grasp domain-containing protein n=1 Tax=Actinacidiphila alni TaxID=380248 RepID=UPI0033F2369A
MAPRDSDTPSLIVLANFASALAVDLREQGAVGQWARQAPREVWLTRPGDVLLTPVPVSEPFARYACGLTGVPRETVRIITVRDRPGMAAADAVRTTPGLSDDLRAHAAARPGTRLLPLALDAPTLALAADLGVPVSPCGRSGPPVGAEALAVAALCNTKAGFRSVARETGIRVPYGHDCRGHELADTVRAVLRRSAAGRAVVKPDRSAGGHGLRFVTRDDALPEAADADSRWTVEEYVPHTASVSAQFLALPTGPRPLFDGVMRTEDGAFTGYRAPLDGRVPAAVRAELGRWGAALGRRLIRHGYRGPYDIDAVVADDGTLYATESNVRRTATTTPYDLVMRLTGGRPVHWSTATAEASGPLTFADALGRLRARGLDFDSGRGAGALLYADAPEDGVRWRYAAVAASAAALDDLEAAVGDALQGHVPG